MRFQGNSLKWTLKQLYQRQLLIRSVATTWSPLATAFNSPPLKRLNFTRNEVGLFGLQELRSHEGFYLMKENAANRTEELIKEILSPTRERKIVECFDELSDVLCKVADLAEFIRMAHPQAEYAMAAEDACIHISSLVERLNTHKELYNVLSDVVQNGDKMSTTEVDRHVAQMFLFDFEQCGIHLKEEDRQRVVRLNDNILQLGQKFMHGAAVPTTFPRNEVPEYLRSVFPNDGKHIIVSGFSSNESSDQAREAAYKLYLHPSERQEELLSDLLKSRHSLARICGFQTFAHRAVNASTVETPEMVEDFLNSLNQGLIPRAQKDFDIMQEMKRHDSKNPSASLAVWDTSYFTSLRKQSILGGKVNEYLPYFSLGGCMEGLNHLLQSLYGVSLENINMEPGESWHPSIYKLAVVHEEDGTLGYIYCDFFERYNKPNQDCHFTIQGGKLLKDGSYQLPKVVVMLNLTSSGWIGPTLLSPSRVDNLFHEMGHAMHSMLARTEYQHVTGTRCSTDFAEVPSVLMEYFANDPRVLKSFARHFQTHQPMPDEMLQRLCDSKNLFLASDTLLQVFYSALDQVYHGDPKKHGTTTTETLKNVHKEYYGLLPYVENTAWQLRFTHLVGYGAKYYAYLISRTIASWIWQTHFEANPFNREAGERYRREVLSHGGGVPSRLLVERFLQRKLTAKSLSENLIHEIDEIHNKLNVNQSLQTSNS